MYGVIYTYMENTENTENIQHLAHTPKFKKEKENSAAFVDAAS